MVTEDATGSQRRAEMQIVTDSGTDLCLSPEQATELNIHVVPLIVTLEGKSYREGVDIQPDEFYGLLAATDSLPITSQPSAGDFVHSHDFRSERHVRRRSSRSKTGARGEHYPR